VEYGPAGYLPTVRSGRRIGIQRKFRAGGDYVGAYYATVPATISLERKKLEGVLVGEPDDIRVGRRTRDAVRFVQMQKVVAEIADKQRRNAPLVLSSRRFRPKRTQLTVLSNDQAAPIRISLPGRVFSSSGNGL
jgi:hypothetical protein